MSRSISVVIPTYNSAAFVVSAVESVLRQEHEPAEIIVIDDGSTDDTAQALAPYRQSIRYITQPNSGPAAARNRGVGAARSDWIAFLDADDVWLPGKLRRQVECMTSNPRAGLIHSAFLDWDSQTGSTSPSRQPPRQDFSGRCYRGFFFQNGVLPSTAFAVSRSSP
jgi:glycosyltransferase involved in cell wall biosynthesis